MERLITKALSLQTKTIGYLLRFANTNNCYSEKVYSSHQKVAERTRAETS